MRSLTGLLIALLLVPACQRSQVQNENASAEVKRYPLKGKVVAVDRTKKTATIAHDEVEGYMPAMTMDFPIKADWV